MKKYIIIILAIFSILATSCDDKDSENISRTIAYPVITLKGQAITIINKGDSYIEPGYTAKNGDTDISDNVTTTSEPDTSKTGSYSITYKVINKDGFSTTTKRMILVVPSNLSSEDISGIYKGQRSGEAETPNACKIIQLGKGVFLADDFWGGYYNIIKKYGSNVRLKTYFVLLDDNTYEAYSSSSPVGALSITGGSYTPSTQKLAHTVEGKYGFDVILTKQE